MSIDISVRAEDQKSITEWVENEFGPAERMRVFDKFNEEVDEFKGTVMLDEPHNAPEEMADVIIVLYHMASLYGVDLHEEIDKKMRINRARDWPARRAAKAAARAAATGRPQLAVITK